MTRKKLVTIPIVGLLTSVFSFLGIISCCGFPLIAAFLAWFGIGASQLSFFSEYQWLFTGIAMIALAYGFYIVYFKRAKTKPVTDCSTEENKELTISCCTPSKKSNWLPKPMLWLGVIAVSASFLLNENVNSEGQMQPDCCSTPEAESTVNKQTVSSCCMDSEIEETAVERKSDKKQSSCCGN